MIHHDSRPYAVAVSEAAKSFQEKLENMIHSSVTRVERVIEQVQNDVPQDYLAPGKQLLFDGENGQMAILAPGMDRAIIHKHALGQIADRVGTKLEIRNFRTVINQLNGMSEWGRKLAAHNLNETYSKLNGDRFLLRVVRDELRGFLSDQYRRLDSRPLCDSFIQAIQRWGARPYDGFALRTKMNMRAILPMVFEPFPGEVMAFGAQLSDSDFGDGALTFSGFCLRLYCTNLATTEDVLSQVHLGRKLSDSVAFSEHTLRLDTQTMASAINDVAKHVLSPTAINSHLDMVKSANSQGIQPDQINTWVKKNLTKAEGDKAVNKFTSADVEMLPPGQTKWRWSNALSWLANETEDEHRKLELQDFAGSILKQKD